MPHIHVHESPLRVDPNAPLKKQEDAGRLAGKLMGSETGNVDVRCHSLDVVGILDPSDRRIVGRAPVGAGQDDREFDKVSEHFQSHHQIGVDLPAAPSTPATT
jgi:hypothetical protein